MKDLDKILQNAEEFMQTARDSEFRIDGETSLSRATYHYMQGIYYEMSALYEQNKAIIELLKGHKE